MTRAASMATSGGSGSSAGMVNTTAASWSTTAEEYRGRSGTFDFDCPPGGSEDRLQGSNSYTDESSVCTAGAHAGVITLERGGRVRIEMRPDQNRYPDSRRNGIQSVPRPSWGNGFAVVD